MSVIHTTLTLESLSCSLSSTEIYPPGTRRWWNTGTVLPAIKIYSPIVGSMFGQRRRRWTNNEPTLGEYLVSSV